MKTQNLDQKLDVRLREKAVRDGALTKQELQDYLKSLPDEAGKSEEVSVFEEPSDETTTPDETIEEPSFSA